jgi:hypothetical protein
MSFDLVLTCLKDGLPDNFPATIVRQALDPFITSRDGDFCKLSFPDGGSGEMFTDDDEETDGLMISRGSGRDLYDALFDILRQTHSVLFWSFGGCVVADPSVIPDLPEGLIESLGPPTIVRNGADIVAAVEQT